ncbi:MAG: hypothetical protein BWY06_01831 [Candidatus Latescibacteria bacterium ADurb.Bin168]|nr:MAG: hypothetical protein BWY06_01831 [Candidatus Latescibacteria bacterium ADurb.Bin168]
MVPFNRHLATFVNSCVFVTLLPACTPKQTTGIDAETRLVLVFTQVPVRGMREIASRAPHPPDFPVGTRIVRWDSQNPSRVEVLSEGFAVAADPCVSFSGDSLLFAGKRSPRDPWNIWVMPLSSRTPTQVTQGLGHCRSPIFLPLSAITGPEFIDKVRWISFTSTVDSIPDVTGTGFAPTLYCRSLNRVESNASIQTPGIVTWRSTFNLTRTFTPTILADGRIAFACLMQQGDSANASAFMTVNWEGTDPNPFLGPATDGTLMSMGTESPDRSFVFVEGSVEAPLASGRLVRVWMRRPMFTRERLSTSPGHYAFPTALPDGRLIVSYAGQLPDFGIFQFDAQHGAPGKMLYDARGWADVQAAPVVQRPEPLGRITMIVDDKPSGDLHCLNVYDSQLEELCRLPRGTIRAVRVIEGTPVPAGEGGASALVPRVRSRIVGEGVVEEDGSFNLVVPGSTPLRFQLLDSSGMARATMHNWMWLHRRDQRGCIGCHENPELAPENRSTQALLRMRADTLLKPPAERESFSFRGDVNPVLQRSCLPCHSGSRISGFSITGNDTTSYQKLFATQQPTGRRFVEKGAARSSVLIWAVRGKVMDTNSGTVRSMPPQMALPRSEIDLLTAWVDFGAPF